MRPVICTYTGVEFNPFAPRLEDINIEDIAHALSNIPRFGGHTNTFYSVAQHAWDVSLMVSSMHAGYGLLHDAAEAYLLDVPTPIKQQMLFMVPGVSGPRSFKDVEWNLLTTIFARFGLERCAELPLQVKRCDYQAYQNERAALLPETEWFPTEVAPRAVNALAPTEAKGLFLRRFHQLVERGLLRDPS